ncbi:MAG: DUF3562 domain-containing protein [Pseudomonadota bacterium]
MATSQRFTDLIHTDVIESLVKELNCPRKMVKDTYFSELARLKADARVEDFLVVLTCRKVRDVLRHHIWRVPSSTSVSLGFRPNSARATREPAAH